MVNRIRKKRFLIIFLVIILMIGVSGCNMNSLNLPENKNDEVVLNDRQKSILAENGLSTNYEELLPSQKLAIVAIEKMLVYAEEKYNMSFSYAGYILPSALDKEQTIAFPTDGDKESECFTITNTGDGYEDNFLSVVANSLFEDYISKGIKSFESETEIKVFAKITKTYLDDIPTSNTDFAGKIESSLCIFVDNATFKSGDLNNFINNFNEYMNDKKLYGIAQIILLKEGKIVYLTSYNYTDYLSKEHYISRETIYIQR